MTGEWKGRGPLVSTHRLLSWDSDRPSKKRLRATELAVFTGKR